MTDPISGQTQPGPEPMNISRAGKYLATASLCSFAVLAALRPG